MKPKENLPEKYSEEKLKAENSLLKMKLTEELGMKSSQSNLDTAVENEWLNYIYNYEKSFSDAKRITIYEFIGRPKFKKVKDLNNKEITSELNRLFENYESK